MQHSTLIFVSIVSSKLIDVRKKFIKILFQKQKADRLTHYCIYGIQWSLWKQKFHLQHLQFSQILSHSILHLTITHVLCTFAYFLTLGGMILNK